MRIKSKQYAQALLASAAGKSREQTNSVISHFVESAVKAGHTKLVREVIQAVDYLEKTEHGQMEVTIATMPGVGSGMSDFIKKGVERQGKQVSVKLHEDASLLGGTVVTIGDRQIDASLKGRLERLKQHLLAE